MKLNLRKLVLGAAIAILPQLMSAQTSIVNSWQSFAIAEGAQNGNFDVTFDMVAEKNNIDAALGFQNGDATAYGDLSPIIRFNSSGEIDARNGGAYESVNPLTYTAGTIYHVAMEINVVDNTYNVMVTPDGGAEVVIGTNYGFRMANTVLDKWSIVAGDWNVADPGTHTISNMVIYPVSGTPIFAEIGSVKMTSGTTMDIDVTVTDPLGGTITLSVDGSSTITSSIVDNTDGTGLLTLSPPVDEFGTLNAVISASSTSGTTKYTIVVNVRDANGLFVIAENANHMIDVNGTQVIEYYDNGVNGNIRNENPKFPMSDVDVWVSRKPNHFLGGLHQYVSTADNPDGETVADYDGIAVYSLLLPIIPNGKSVDDLEDAIFSFNLSTNTAWGVVSFDLYGLDARDNADVLGTDFYVGPASTSTSGTIIQEDIFNQSTLAGTITTSDNANVALTDYIKAQYNAGNAGKYIFLRINHTQKEITTYLRAQITTADQDPSSVKLELNFGSDNGLANETIEKSSLSIYPNPVTNGEFTVSTKGMKGNVEMSIYNVIGELVYSKSINAAVNSTTVNANLSQGLYIVKLTDGTSAKTQKISVQ